MKQQSVFTKCILALGVLSSSIAMAGGVTGGGGNSRTSGFMTPSEAANVIQDSYLDALLAARLVGHLYLANPNAMPAGLTPLYAQPSELERAFLKLKINIKVSGPCMGTDGSENDGWFDPATPNEICISAFNLSKKVQVSDMAAQVKALVLHEISHSFGLNEQDATAYQDLILKYAPVSQKQVTNYPTENLNNATSVFADTLMRKADQLQQASIAQKCQLSKELSKDLVNISQTIFLQNSGLLLETHRSFRFVALQYRLAALNAQSCYLANPNEDTLKEYDLYQNIFKSFKKDRLTMSEFARGMGLGLSVDVVGDVVPQVRTEADAAREVFFLREAINDLWGDLVTTEFMVKQGFLTSRQ